MDITIMETLENLDLCDNLLANMTISVLGYKRDVGVVFKKEDDERVIAEVKNGRLVMTENVYNEIGKFIQRKMFWALQTVSDVLPHRAVGVAFANGDLTKPVFTFNFKINKRNRGRCFTIKFCDKPDYEAFKKDVIFLQDKTTVDFE